MLLVLSWMFVLSRLVHAYIHVTCNRLDRRTAVFLVGAIALLPHVGDRHRPHPLARLDLMTPGARASAAIEVLADIEARKRPAAEALKDWGLAHRFAGSGDRAAIGNLVFDALRTRASKCLRHGRGRSPRACAPHPGPELEGDPGGGRCSRRWQPACAGSRSRLPSLPGSSAGFRPMLPPHVRGDYPEWLAPRIRAGLRRAGGRGGGGACLARPDRSPGQHAESRRATRC